jgi:hypothetical protein
MGEEGPANEIAPETFGSDRKASQAPPREMARQTAAKVRKIRLNQIIVFTAVVGGSAIF